MPCCGQLEYTRLSVPRVFHHSRRPFEVIFVSAGALDGTVDYLEGVAAAAAVRVEVVQSASDADFPALVREGVARAQGGLVLWLNNDVLVPEFWQEQLVALALSNPVIGMVGPMANIAPEPQRVEAVPYRLRRPAGARSSGGSEPAARLETRVVDEFARQIREKQKGQWTEAERLGGFCFGIKRELLGAVSLLDEGQEEAVLDGARLSARVRRAGNRLTCCRDLFVHHFGICLARV
jgi:GT2 family glycosyltransferase